MSDEEDRFLGFLRDTHEHLGHDTDLGDASWTSIDTITREDRDRVDDNDLGRMELDRRDDVIEVGLRDQGDILTRDSESLRSHGNLPDMLFSRDIEYWGRYMRSE